MWENLKTLVLQVCSANIKAKPSQNLTIETGESFSDWYLAIALDGEWKWTDSFQQPRKWTCQISSKSFKISTRCKKYNLLWFFFSANPCIFCIARRLSMYLSSSPETSRYTENIWICRKKNHKLYFLHLVYNQWQKSLPKDKKFTK